MKGTRKRGTTHAQHVAKFTAQTAIAALLEEKTLTELSSEYGKAQVSKLTDVFLPLRPLRVLDATIYAARRQHHLEIAYLRRFQRHSLKRLQIVGPPVPVRTAFPLVRRKKANSYIQQLITTLVQHKKSRHSQAQPRHSRHHEGTHRIQSKKQSRTATAAI